MEDHYSVLGVTPQADALEIKKAFREKAKMLHPDVAGNSRLEKAAAGERMRRLLVAYNALRDARRRADYDSFLRRFNAQTGFDYRTFLRERRDDPESQARLIMFALLHAEEEEAVAVWHTQGGVAFTMERYLERGDWMDCAFLLAEELEKRGHYTEALFLLDAILRAEKAAPYFRHFTREVEDCRKRVNRVQRREMRKKV